MITLDGSYGEGGGQMLRTALLLSLLTDQPFRIEQIRAGRANPGLKAQHLHIIEALQAMSDARAEGVALGSMAVTFWPGQVRGGEYSFAIGTAGAIPLFLQTLLPVACFAGAPVTFTVSGGTDVRGAMTIAFWQAVILPFLTPYAAALQIAVLRHGYFPVGGGQVRVTVTPHFAQRTWPTAVHPFPPLQISERGELQGIDVISTAARQLREQRVATRQAVAFNAVLTTPAPRAQLLNTKAASPGSSVTAVAHYTHTRLGADALGERGKPSEQVGREAAQQLQTEMAGTGVVDVHTADNLMVWAAIFGGHYRFGTLTGHIATNGWVINQFLPAALHVNATERAVASATKA
jgi:RNA 3'-terminal phosphate cyclase (ATP)/RNA 3'-terminal phosphate cyclase (GTP)